MKPPAGLTPSSWRRLVAAIRKTGRQVQLGAVTPAAARQQVKALARAAVS